MENKRENTKPLDPRKMAAMELAYEVAQRYSSLPQVEAVALGGSLATHTADAGSDLDLYVYVREELPRETRARIAHMQGTHVEVDNRFWEPGDEWVDAATGIHVDVMFRLVSWIEKQLDEVLWWHKASVGYTTSFWYNVRTSQPLFDRDGWFRDLQQHTQQPFPTELREAIVAKNHPILRDTLSSYLYQIERAVERDDWVSINHRVAVLLASYFDLLFAINRQPHPGEKRLLTVVETLCPARPPHMAAQVRALLAAVPDGGETIIARATALLDGLDALLREEGLLPLPSQG